MSEELKGSCGEIVGTDNYFKKLNENNNIAKLMSDSKKSNYYDSINAISRKIQDCIDEIKDDLKDKAKMLRFIDSDKRKNTVDFVKSLENTCKIVGASCSKASDCIYFLELRDSLTYPKTSTSSSDLDRALKIVQNGGNVSISSSDRKDILEKAVKNSIQWAVGSDERKKAYIAEVLQGNKEEFLIDVWNKLCYYDGNQYLRGKCGKTICTTEYMKYYENKIFNSAFSSSYTCEYDKEIKKSLEQIAKDIAYDLGNGIKGQVYISAENIKTLQSVWKCLKLIINVTSIDNLLKKSSARDITDELQKILIRCEYEKSDYKYLPWFAKLDVFMELVADGKELDLKTKADWKDSKFIFDGNLVRYDAPGNIAYGYMGMVFGIPKKILLSAAGIVQVIDKTSNLKTALPEYILSSATNFRFISNLKKFDDGYDQKMIELGIAYYEKTH